MKTDMTKGNPMKIILMFSIPVLMGNLFQQFYNMVDTIIVGQYLGSDALAAVGSTGCLMFLVLGFANGIAQGFGVMVSHAFGAKNEKLLKHYVALAIILTVIVSAVLTIPTVLASKQFLIWMNTPENILDMADAYIKAIFAGIFCTMSYNVASGLLRSIGDSKTPLYFLLGSSAGNIILDYIFVAKFQWGVSGVAWATFIAQGVSAVLALVTLLGRLQKFAGEEKQPWFDKKLFGQIMAIAIPSILQQSVLSVGNLFVQGIVNQFGSAVVAGYSGAIKLNTFAINIFMTLGSCLSSYTAQNIGAGKKERIPLGFRTGVKLSELTALPFVILYFIFSRQMMGLFLGAESAEAISAGMAFLKIVSPWYFMIAIKLMTDGIIRGSGAMVYFVVATVPDLILRIGFALVLTKSFGSTGIWMAWPFGWIVATTLTLIFYRKLGYKNDKSSNI